MVVSSVPYIFFSLVRFVFDVLVNGVGWLIAAKAGGSCRSGWYKYFVWCCLLAID